MGIYINTGNEGFRSSRSSEYVDKSGLIAVVNQTLFSERRFNCVARSRRFGKTMAVKMLAAYYDKSCDSRSLFSDLEIAKDPSFERHLNKYPVICLDAASFVVSFRDGEVVKEMDAAVLADVKKAYPSVEVGEKDDLMDFLMRVASETGERFIFIIDEWDAICREFPASSSMMGKYVDWLRKLFKSLQAINVFAGVYMTGILPIKKYKTESALNNFIEYSMVNPRRMARYFGFTKDEVCELAAKYDLDFDELVKWYDGYQIGDEPSMFNPNSVMQVVDSGECASYWGKTGAYDAVSSYIQMNYGGLKDDVIKMLAGGRCKVDPTGFQNDMSVIRSKDDVFTVLIHLGYLAFDRKKGECYVPNYEVEGELVNAVKATNWTYLGDALRQSEELLQATIDGDEEAVARGVDVAHDEHTSILSYNNENSLACVLSIAYYCARKDYVMYRELPSGKGFADIVLIPRKNVDSPALVLELKFNRDADAAIDQIKRKHYPAKLEQYAGHLLLVGINYDKATKSHNCRIEKA